MGNCAADYNCIPCTNYYVIKFFGKCCNSIAQYSRGKNWGRIYYTIALTDASSQYELLFLSPYKILSHYKAIEALLMTMGMVFLVLTFLGVAMFSISIFFQIALRLFWRNICDFPIGCG